MLEGIAIFTAILAGVRVKYMLIWFVISAALVGLISNLVQMDLSTQALLWLVLSHLPMEVWYRFVRPQINDRVFKRLLQERSSDKPDK